MARRAGAPQLLAHSLRMLSHTDCSTSVKPERRIIAVARQGGTFSKDIFRLRWLGIKLSQLAWPWRVLGQLILRAPERLMAFDDAYVAGGTPIFRRSTRVLSCNMPPLQRHP